jgi:hypothetical protein
MRVKCRSCSKTFRNAAGRSAHERFKHPSVGSTARAVEKATRKASLPASVASVGISDGRPGWAARGAVQFCPRCRFPAGALSDALGAARVGVEFCPTCGCSITAVRRALADAGFTVGG